MKQVVIADPILNSPFEEPSRHFKFNDDGITDEVVLSRRISTYFIPIPAPKKRGGNQMYLPGDWTADRVQENEFINRVRERVSIWRKGGYAGITSVTRRLLEYWQRPGRERRLFFCQIEALETAIYITEVAGRYGDTWIDNSLRDFNASTNPLLYGLHSRWRPGAVKLW